MLSPKNWILTLLQIQTYDLYVATIWLSIYIHTYKSLKFRQNKIACAIFQQQCNLIHVPLTNLYFMLVWETNTYCQLSRALSVSATTAKFPKFI